MSLFQRRHYYKIGDLLIEHHAHFGLTEQALEQLVDSFADMFMMDNPNFNHKIFFEYVGVWQDDDR